MRLPLSPANASRWLARMALPLRPQAGTLIRLIRLQTRLKRVRLCPDQVEQWMASNELSLQVLEDVRKQVVEAMSARVRSDHAMAVCVCVCVCVFVCVCVCESQTVLKDIR